MSIDTNKNKFKIDDDITLQGGDDTRNLIKYKTKTKQDLYMLTRNHGFCQFQYSEDLLLDSRQSTGNMNTMKSSQTPFQ